MMEVYQEIMEQQENPDDFESQGENIYMGHNDTDFGRNQFITKMESADSMLKSNNDKNVHKVGDISVFKDMTSNENSNVGLQRTGSVTAGKDNSSSVDDLSERDTVILKTNLESEKNRSYGFDKNADDSNYTTDKQKDISHTISEISTKGKGNPIGGIFTEKLTDRKSYQEGIDWVENNTTETLEESVKRDNSSSYVKSVANAGDTTGTPDDNINLIRKGTAEIDRIPEKLNDQNVPDTNENETNSIGFIDPWEQSRTYLQQKRVVQIFQVCNVIPIMLHTAFQALLKRSISGLARRRVFYVTSVQFIVYFT